MTADTYLQHQSKKLSNKTTDPLAETLKNINNNPALYATERAMTTSNTCDQYEEQNATKSVQKEADIEQYHKKAGDSQEKGIINICEKNNPDKKTKSIGQDLDALSKNRSIGPELMTAKTGPIHLSSFVEIAFVD